MSKESERVAVNSPPAGTGHVPGLGEAFNINLSTGQGVYSFKLALPDGVAGHSPRLALEYVHGAGHGAFGLGWRLPLRRIARRLDFGVPLSGAEERFIADGTDLLTMPDSTYAARAETVFSRYIRLHDGWRIEERDGSVHELGTAAHARLTDPDHPDRVDEWLLERSLDTSGNSIAYRYRIEEGTPYLTEARYAIYALRLEYEDRPDPRTNGRPGYLRKCARRCREMALFLDPGPEERRIRSWTLVYSQAVGSDVSLLTAIHMRSHGTNPDGSGDVTRPPTTFEYTPFDIKSSTVRRTVAPDGSSPPPLTDPEVALVTLDSAPLPGVLQNRNGRQYYWRNLGDGTWAPPRPLGPSPAVSSFAGSGLAFLDMDGSGTADLLVAAGESLPGYYENGGREGWRRFVAFPRGRRAAPYWASGQVRLSDVSGDGRVDAMSSAGRSFAVWLNRGQEGWSEPLLTPRPEESMPDFSDPLVFLADLNGDGLDDLVRVRSGLVAYWPGLGYGRFGSRQAMGNSPRLQNLTPVPGRSDGSPPLWIDVDGDGCVDLVRATAYGVEVFLNRNGLRFADAALLPDVPSPIPGTVRPLNLRGRSGAGLVWNAPHGRQTGYIHLEFGSGQPAYLLSRVKNGSGLTSEISYRSAVEDFCRDREAAVAWDTNFPFPYLVVAGTRETDEVSGRITETRYRYREAHFEPSARQFQGFRRVERQEVGDESRADTLTVFHFLMGQERLPGNGPEHAALNGMLRRTEVYGLDGSDLENRPYRIEESDYDLLILQEAAAGQQRTFISVIRHRVEDMERTNDLRGEEKTYAYDAWGNVIREAHHAYGRRNGAAQPERMRVTEIHYVGANDRHLKDRPARVVVRDEQGRILSEERRYYDGPDFEGLPIGQAARGLMTRKDRLVLSETGFQRHYAGMDADALGYAADTDADGVPAYFIHHERCAYGEHGEKIADRDALGHETRYGYDADTLFRVELTTTLGRTRFDYDRATGQPLRIAYPDGSVSTFAYDAQGRVLAAALPGDSLEDPPTTYRYDDKTLPVARIGHFRPTAGSAEEAVAITLFDGHGKEFQQRAQVGPGRFAVSSLRVFNPWGDVKAEYEPTYEDSSAYTGPPGNNRPGRRMEYDALGRVVKTVNYNGGVSTAEYRPFEVITRDANDNDDSPENRQRGQFDTPHREEFDVFRYRTAVTEELGGGQAVRYSYLPGSQGELLQISDDRGAVAAYEYDRLGQRLAISHREAGDRSLWYDGRGMVVRTLDANGNDIRADIDARQRLTRLEWNGDILESYIYDDPARHAQGRLAEAVYPGGRQRFEYDEQGRLTAREYHDDWLPAPQRIAYTYDRLGRQISMAHSEGGQERFSIRYRMTDNGWIRAIPGYIDEVGYDPRGLPERIVYANGVRTEMTYSSGPGRVVSQNTTGPSGLALEQVTHEYDRMEMLLASNDTAPGGRGLSRFAYDPLYQISSATFPESGVPGERRYEYAGGLNLMRFGETGGDFHYDDPLHSDRLAGLTRGDGVRFDTAYDANGNLTSLPGKTFHYNAKNELSRFEADGGLMAEYGYDHKGDRIRKAVTDAGGAVARTVFLGNTVEIRNGQPTYFVSLGSLRVAVVTGGQTRFVHGDYLGSTAFFTDTGGAKIAAIACLPFGNVATSQGAVDHRTFGVHPFDTESGLYYMRRRYYAPEIGRFLTPDPLAVYQPTVNLHNPKALHPYNFVANDPLNKADPSGLSFWSVVGAIVGVVAAIGLAVLVVATGGWFGVLMAASLALGVVSISYVVASETAGTDFGEFMRGFLIGFNAGFNGALGIVIFGPVVGTALGVINFLAAFDNIAGNSVYQGILGWSSWLMPMSWLATSIGLVFFILNVIPVIFTFNQVEAVKIHRLSIDWGTGTIVMEGGWTFLPGFRGGFNLGNFAYITPGSTVTDHETGHTLNVAAFGSVFHFIGAIDQNIIQGTPENAFSERLADSHDPNGPAQRAAAGQDPVVPTWV